MKKRELIHFITDAAIFAAVGFVLDFIQGQICHFLPFWPNGGSVGIAMCAVFVISYKYGLKGMLVGFIIGLFSMLGGTYVSPIADNFLSVVIQLFLDYYGAWMVVGLAGLFAKQLSKATINKNKILIVCLSVFVATFARFVCHTLSGVLYWPDDSKASMFWYSVGYNASYVFPSGVLCAIIMCVIAVKFPKLISRNEEVSEDKQNG